MLVRGTCGCTRQIPVRVAARGDISAGSDRMPTAHGAHSETKPSLEAERRGLRQVYEPTMGKQRESSFLPTSNGVIVRSREPRDIFFFGIAIRFDTKITSF